MKMWLPYDDSVVDDWFTKEKDYLIRTKFGTIRIAGLFHVTDSWEWVSNESVKIIPRNTILQYMVIPD